LTLDDFKALVLDFVDGLLLASATERLPWGVPDGATIFFVVFAVLVFFLAFVPAVDFLTPLPAGSIAVCATSGAAVRAKVRLTRPLSQTFRQDKLNFKNI
jgi:hypothetical protein